MTAVIKRDELPAQIEKVLVGGDLSQLQPADRVAYYKMVCESVGLNPLTRPLEYITLNGKLTLYARKDCTDQLRSIHGVSVTIMARELVDDCYVVTARATLPSGRTDESIGAVPLGNLKGDAKCNSMMKGETKAKRRVTLSICGLGMLDETEIETIPSAKPPDAKISTQAVIFEDSAADNSVQGSPDVKGESSAPSAEVVEQLETSIELIGIGQQKNLHAQFRKTFKEFHPDLADKADDYLYQWLAEKGFRDKNKLPTAAAIPASGWFQTRDDAIAYAKTLKMVR